MTIFIHTTNLVVEISPTVRNIQIGHVFFHKVAAATILFTIHFQLECGPMRNVMAALPNLGGALCFNAAKFG